MSLHQIDETHDDAQVMAVPRYASELATHTLPKHRMPDAGVPANVAHDIVRDELMLDGNSCQSLATFCTTWVSPEVRECMADCVDKNMIDKDEYPQTAEIESSRISCGISASTA